MAALDLGNDPRGNGHAHSLSVWSAAVEPRLRVSRVRLQFEDRPVQQVVVNTGAFWLETGGVCGAVVTASSLGYFSEAEAGRHCHPGREHVDWRAHRKLAGRLRRYLYREVPAARVPASGKPRGAVLAGALARVRAGAVLKEEAGFPWAWGVDAGSGAAADRGGR